MSVPVPCLTQVYLLTWDNVSEITGKAGNSLPAKLSITEQSNLYMK